MLQIEIVWGDAGGLSKSITSEADFAELLLQIEIEEREGFLCLDL